MRIAVGSDHRGVRLRAKLVELLGRLGQEVIDLGKDERTTVDYPDMAEAVGRLVSRREADRGSRGPVWGCASWPTSCPACARPPATTS